MFRTRALTSLVAVLLGLTACSSDDPAPAPAEAATPTVASFEPSQPASETAEATDAPTPVEASAAPSTSPSISESNFKRPNVVLTDEQEAALDTVEEFFHYYDKAFEDPSQPYQRLSELIDGEFHQLIAHGLATELEQGASQRGKPHYRVVEIEPSKEVEGETWLDVYVCSDLDDVRTVNAETGATIHEPNERYQVFKLSLRKRESWKIPVGGNRWSPRCER